MPFRPEGALKLDLGKGELAAGSGRVVALPCRTFLALARAVEATSESAVTLYAAGREWGETIANEVSDEIRGTTGKPPRDVPPAEVVDQLAGSLSALGWGSLTMEVWGEGLVFSLENAPTDGASPARHLLAGFFGGFASVLGGKPFAGAVVGTTPTLRVLVGNPSAIKAARRWHEEGVALGAIVDRILAGEHRREA